ncbi:hypothetical protein [Sphaerisporangium fuscum]|uniref:hypothetical protein n=1 Tax=Sphaerisporangium fuscum TaxID=2835868 RepID=UPI001BDCB79A|nr:hypothetical protein [Sphaerisporangium fuscum]
MVPVFDASAAQHQLVPGELAAAVEAFLSGWTARTGIPVEVWALPPAGVVPHEAAVVAYHVLVDAFNGVQDAQRVSVALTAGRALRLTVSYEGRATVPGHGEARLRARAAELGGVYSTTVTAGTATTVSLELPLAASR